jgi:hypothetical protein
VPLTAWGNEVVNNTVGSLHTTTLCRDRLKAQRDEARADERARIVKWLRETGRYDGPWNLGDAADAIERGEHDAKTASPIDSQPEPHEPR